MAAHKDASMQWISLAAGGIAGGVEAAATYPFEFAKTRVQLRGENVPRNPYAIVGRVYTEEGFRALYKGCSTMIVGSIAKDGVRFLSFDSIKSLFADPETAQLSPLRSLLSGMSAGIVASVFAVTPTERIKTAMIDDAKGAKRFESPLHAVRLLVREQGPTRALYRGLGGTTLKQATATSARMGSYNIVKQLEQDRGIEQNVVTNFANGGIAGTITVYTTQPFDTIKTRSQSAKGASLREAFSEIVQNDGIKGFWRGSIMRMSRVVFSGGILFTTYEQVSKLLHFTLRTEHAAA